jgi:hypothetical protein
MDMANDATPENAVPASRVRSSLDSRLSMLKLDRGAVPVIELEETEWG